MDRARNRGAAWLGFGKSRVRHQMRRGGTGRRGDWERGGVLLEEARYFPRWNQTLALLWFEDGDVPREKRELREDEEELELEELDGYLRWPSKKRRR
jgi:hypothetical protein